MLRLYCALIGPLVALVVIARCVGQSGQAQDPPKEEAQCSPQEVADRFLEVRARLDKPGERPEYRLGEPVVVELDIRNMSEGHLFTIPYSGILVAGEPMMPATQYVVEATRYGKPVPHTILGRMTFERLKRGDDIEGGVAHRFAEGLDDPRSKFPHTEQPIPAKIKANLLCDMTVLGDYELQVRFRVRVFSLADGEGPEVLGAGKSVVKEVRFARPLRLYIDGRFYQCEPPPVNVRPSSKP